jgi:hypothetical protein
LCTVGAEDRVQVDDVDAQCLLDVAELLVDAGQVAAEEHQVVVAAASGEHAAAPGVLLGGIAVVAVLAVGDIVAGVAVVEAVREDLVHHPVLHPARRGEAGDDEEVAAGWLGRGGAGRVEPRRRGTVVDLETVVLLRGTGRDGALPVVERAGRIVG